MAKGTRRPLKTLGYTEELSATSYAGKPGNTCNRALMSKNSQPVFEVVLRVKPDASDPTGVRRLRAFLKSALRRWRMRCVTVRRLENDTHCDVTGEV